MAMLNVESSEVFPAGGVEEAGEGEGSGGENGPFWRIRWLSGETSSVALHTMKLLVTFSPSVSECRLQVGAVSGKIGGCTAETGEEKNQEGKKEETEGGRRGGGGGAVAVCGLLVHAYSSCLPVVQVEVTVRCTAEDELPLVHTLTSKTKIRYLLLWCHHVLPW